MRHAPHFAFYLAAAVLLASSAAKHWTAKDGNRVAFSISMQSGHLSLQAELGASLLALRL